MRRYLLLFKRLFNIQFSDTDQDYYFQRNLNQRTAVTDYKVVDGILQFNLPGQSKVFLRSAPHSDPLVFNQVFLNHEYKTAVDYIKDNQVDARSIKILDAGANIGLASAYLLSNFPQAEILCVEPGPENIVILKKNLKRFIADGQVSIYENAVTGESNKNLVIEKSFRDGRDWAISVNESSDSTGLKSVTVEQLMAENGWDKIDILKMDIEGSERFVFNQNADVSFLKRVRILALEIHDEFDIRDQIYELLRDKGFLIFNFAETTFAINKGFEEVSG